MRSLIVGGGAIGQFLAVRLAQGGLTPVIFARAEQVAAINAGPITLQLRDGVIAQRVRAVSDPADEALTDPFELAIVAVKAYATAGAVRSLRAIPQCARATMLTVQNGLGNEEILADAFGVEQVVAGALTVAVDRLSATSISASDKGGLSLAPLGTIPHNWLMAAFGGSGMTVSAVGDWRALKWSKLLINILGNGVCAALDWLPEQVYADLNAFAIERRCLLEALAVMRRLKIQPVNLIDYPSAVLAVAAGLLPPPVLRVVLAKRVVTGRGGKLPSLLMDLRAHRPRSEVEALNGGVAAQAAKAGIEAPANAAVARIVSGIANGTLRWEEYRGHPERLFKD
ncbi:MAG: 2-dehydropantoate 2-reductase [Candidatus Eremiobacteraeota bacterium]|nr:2-dehydropantoate 2-reductase [Candidatus Eremiobacteraeota bacterium]